ncbi:MAG: hypothetical protein ACRDA4_05510 [Filifactoraceae bacterium]
MSESVELAIVSNDPIVDEIYDVGGNIGCYIACTGGCIITEMIGAPMVVATLAMS